jgi:two-component system sensor histidine kinase HydH
MDGHAVVTIIACAGHLAFGMLAFVRRSKSALGGLMALLFFDAFGWNFASLAAELSGSVLWWRVDRFFSSMMVPLALHVVVVFVGRRRALGGALGAAYASFAFVGLVIPDSSWWWTLLVSALVAMGTAIVLLLVHRNRVFDPAERARADLLLLALSVGTLLGATDLLHGRLAFPVPRLAAIGTLAAMSLIAIAALRLSLFGREVPKIIALYALLLGAFWVAAHLALARYLDPQSSPWVLGGVALALVGLASSRELGRSAALRRAQNEELATLGRFSQQLAHDLKNPLAALKGAVEFLTEEHRAGRSLDGQSRFLALMAEQVDRTERTVEHYQRIAKVDPRPAPASLNGIVESVIPLQRLALGRAVSIRTELAATLPSCPLDRDLVVTALENVLRNASEAMPKGGAITVRTQLEADGQAVVLGIEDEGQGMSPMVLERATALFFTTKAQGTGLGLSFADRVARAHGGALALASALGRGTTVTLTFPLAEASGAA